MRRSATMRRTVFLAMILLTVTGCATIRAGETRSTEQTLAATGFPMKAPGTPEKVANLRAFTPKKMTVQRRGAEPYYVYADPDLCNCIYMGTEVQYQKYLGRLMRKELADAQAEASMDWGLSDLWPWW
jgi:hypothetical protein